MTISCLIRKLPARGSGKMKLKWFEKADNLSLHHYLLCLRKRRLRNARKNAILMTRQYSDVTSASELRFVESNFPRRLRAKFSSLRRVHRHACMSKFCSLVYLNESLT